MVSVSGQRQRFTEESIKRGKELLQIIDELNSLHKTQVRLLSEKMRSGLNDFETAAAEIIGESWNVGRSIMLYALLLERSSLLAKRSQDVELTLLPGLVDFHTLSHRKQWERFLDTLAEKRKRNRTVRTLATVGMSLFVFLIGYYVMYS